MSSKNCRVCGYELDEIWDTHFFDRGVESRPGSLPVNRASMRYRAKSRALAPPPPVASLYPQLRYRQQVSRQPVANCVPSNSAQSAKQRPAPDGAGLFVSTPLAGKRVAGETLRGISVVCLPAESPLRLLCSGELVSLCGSDRGVNDEQGT